MRERPILFSTPMVQAILAGKKTMTRRIVKWQPYHEGESINFNFSGISLGHYCTGVPESGYVLYSRGGGGCWNQRTKPIHCPYGKPGDILWVREAWSKDKNNEYVYRANYGTTEDDSFPPSMFKWRPSIFMPREACRIKLRITDIRVERLQDISEDDAKAEGVSDPYDYQNPEYYEQPHMRGLEINKSAFAGLWDSLNVKRGYGWDTNPWVWVIEFERVEGMKC